MVLLPLLLLVVLKLVLVRMLVLLLPMLMPLPLVVMGLDPKLENEQQGLILDHDQIHLL